MPLRDEIPQRIIFRRHPALLQAVFLVIGLLCGYRYPTFYSPVFILLGAISLFLLTYLSSPFYSMSHFLRSMLSVFHIH